MTFAELEALPENSWGIKEPPEGWGVGRLDASPAEGEGAAVDLVLVPAMCFDKAGSRCGHGRGYYDSFLERTFAAADAAGRFNPECNSHLYHIPKLTLV